MKRIKLDTTPDTQAELDHLRTWLPLRDAVTPDTNEQITARIWALTIKLDQTA